MTVLLHNVNKYRQSCNAHHLTDNYQEQISESIINKCTQNMNRLNT